MQEKRREGDPSFLRNAPIPNKEVLTAYMLKSYYTRIRNVNGGLNHMSERLGVGATDTPLWGRPYTYPLPTRAVTHLGHGKHLCHLVEDMGIGIDEYKQLIKNAKFLCKKCGRVAAREENLCEPVKL